MLKTTAVDTLISMFIITIHCIIWYLKYRGVDAESRASGVKMEIREIHKFKN